MYIFLIVGPVNLESCQELIISYKWSQLVADVQKSKMSLKTNFSRMSYRIKNKSTNREHHYESRHSGMKIRKNVTLVIRPMNRETA